MNDEFEDAGPIIALKTNSAIPKMLRNYYGVDFHVLCGV